MIGNKRGFTLMEMMIAVAIFALITVMAASIFRNTMTAQRQSISEVDAEESVKYFMEVFSREVRTAERNSSTGDVCGVGSNHILVASDDGSELYFKNQAGACVVYKTVVDPKNILRVDVRRYSDIDDYEAYLSPASLPLKSLAFVVDDVSSTTQPVVTLNLKLAVPSNNQLTDYNIQTTISPREFNFY